MVCIIIFPIIILQLNFISYSRIPSFNLPRPYKDLFSLLSAPFDTSSNLICIVNNNPIICLMDMRSPAICSSSWLNSSPNSKLNWFHLCSLFISDLLFFSSSIPFSSLITILKSQKYTIRHNPLPTNIFHNRSINHKKATFSQSWISWTMRLSNLWQRESYSHACRWPFIRWHCRTQNFRLLMRFLRQGLFLPFSSMRLSARYLFIVCQIKILKIHLYLTLMSFLGVIFILLPGKNNKNSTIDSSGNEGFVVYLLPLLSAFTSACSMSYLHRLKQKVHPLLTLQYLMFGALIASGILSNFDSDPIIHRSANSPIFSSIFSFLFVGSTVVMSFLVYLSQYFRVKSLFILPASKVAPLHYFGIVLSILFDLVVFDYQIKWYQYIGMVLSSSGLMMKLLIEKWQQETKSSSNESGQF